jgi:hypothetical protein
MTGLLLLLAQVPAPIPGTGGPAPVVPVEMSATLITAFAAAAVLIIGAIVTGAVKIITALHETRDEVVATKTEAVAAKHEAIAAKTVGLETRDLVDGRYGEVLQQYADMTRLVALMSGTDVDQFRATDAQEKASSQQARAKAAAATTAATAPRQPGEERRVAPAEAPVDTAPAVVAPDPTAGGAVKP